MNYLRNRLLYFLLLPLSMFCVALSGADAGAASPVDNVVWTTDELILSANAYGYDCPSQDRTLTWSEPLQNDPTFMQALQTGSWIVIQHDRIAPNPNIRMVRVVWSQYTRLSVNFNAYSDGYYEMRAYTTDNSDIYASDIQQNVSGYNSLPQSCDVIATTYNMGNEYQIHTNYNHSQNGFETRLFMAPNVDINYPQNYEGEIVPESVTPPTPPPTNTPDIKIINVLNNEVTFTDDNFYTIDGIQWTCSEDGNSILNDDTGLAPVLYYQIWRNDVSPNVMITDGYQSASSPLTYKFNKNPTEREYRIAAWYDCGGDVQFSDASNTIFTVTPQGTLKQDIFEDCISEEFPFLHLSSCMNNLETIINLLIFNEVSFPAFTFSPACRNLETMDNWLGLPENYQVCPQVPSYIRTVTTPFVAFLLGLITTKFLKRATDQNIYG